MTCPLDTDPTPLSMVAVTPVKVGVKVVVVPLFIVEAPPTNEVMVGAGTTVRFTEPVALPPEVVTIHCVAPAELRDLPRASWYGTRLTHGFMG